jgi:hypothetical protein
MDYRLQLTEILVLLLLISENMYLIVLVGRDSHVKIKITAARPRLSRSRLSSSREIFLQVYHDCNMRPLVNDGLVGYVPVSLISMLTTCVRMTIG